MTLSEACEAYRRDVIIFQNQSKKTEENHYYIAVKSLLEYVGDIDISSLQFEHVRGWKESLDKTRSPATVRNYIIKLRVILAHTLKLGVKCLDPDLIAVSKLLGHASIQTTQIYLHVTDLHLEKEYKKYHTI